MSLEESQVVEVKPDVDQEDVVEASTPIEWVDVTAVDPVGL